MSFLKKLQEVGIGNRGPYGRQQSGASYLTDVIQDRLQVETGRGVEKALIGATKGGNPISPEQQIEIAERWSVPLQQVMEMSKKINEPIETRRLENFSKSMMMRFYNYAEENPGIQPKMDKVMQWVKDAGGDPKEDGPMAMAILQKIITAKEARFDTLSSGQQLFKTIGDKSSLVAENKKVDVPEKPEKLTDFRTAYNQYIKIPGNEKVAMAKFKTDVWEKKKDGGESISDKKERVADIRSQAQQLTGIGSGENLVKEIMATPEHKASVKRAKRQLFTMIKRFVADFGEAAAEAAGFDTQLIKQYESELSPMQSPGLPEGLTEEIIKDYNTKYGLTREQVIAAWGRKNAQ